MPPPSARVTMLRRESRRACSGVSSPVSMRTTSVSPVWVCVIYAWLKEAVKVRLWSKDSKLMVPPREEEVSIDGDSELVAVDDTEPAPRTDEAPVEPPSEAAFVEAPPSEQPPGLLPSVSLKGLFAGDAGQDGPVDPVLPSTLFTVKARPVREDVATSTSASRPATGVTDGSPPDPNTGSRRKGPRRSGSDVDLPSPGAIIDKYRLEEMVGKGGFAAVYRATHLLLNMPVAIKLLRPKAMKKHPNLAALLCEEARFAAKIDHPNVVRIHDVTHTPAITYIVMEFLRGTSLSARMKTTPPLTLDYDL